MDVLRQALQGISGGNVLDVATGEGHFIEVLAEALRDWDHITGIDQRDRRPDGGGRVFDRKGVQFVQMDAANLSFGDGSFDTVSASNSLHHLADHRRCLSEMMRVLRPGGCVIVREMFRDGDQTEAQQTHIHLHHWLAGIHTAQGLTHKETFTRQELVDLVGELGLLGMVFYDYRHPGLDPGKGKAFERVEETIDGFIKQAADLPGAAELVRRGEEVRNWLHAHGTDRATELVVVGMKPGT